MNQTTAIPPIGFQSALAVIRVSLTRNTFWLVLVMALVIGVLVELPYFFLEELDATRMSNMLMLFLIAPFKILIESMLWQLGVIEREPVPSAIKLFVLSIILNVIYLVGGLLLIIPFFVLYVRLCASYAIYLAEPVSMTDAIGRSWTETRQIWGGIAKLVFAVAFVYLAIFIPYIFWPTDPYQTYLIASAILGVILSLISVFVGFIPVIVYAHIRNVEIAS